MFLMEVLVEELEKVGLSSNAIMFMIEMLVEELEKVGLSLNANRTITGSHEPKRRSYDYLFFYPICYTDMLSAIACSLSTLDIGSR